MTIKRIWQFIAVCSLNKVLKIDNTLNIKNPKNSFILLIFSIARYRFTEYHLNI